MRWSLRGRGPGRTNISDIERSRDSGVSFHERFFGFLSFIGALSGVCITCLGLAWLCEWDIAGGFR
jgi:hypothetical protein